jgi:pilus assembly protein CpaB
MVFRLGILAVFLVALVAVLIFGFSLMDQSKPDATEAAPPPPPPTEQVLVAADQLNGGALLQPSDITATSMLVSAAPVDALVDTQQNRAELVGSMVRQTMVQGTPIVDIDLIHPGDHSFLAAALKPGMEAVTVAVDNVTGADGLIWPGDYVDVLLTQSISGAPDDKSIAAELVLNNVRVIATGSELIKSAGADANASSSAQTVTLEVTADQASRCLVASNLGKLSLIVHSASQTTASRLPGSTSPVWAGDVSPALANSNPVETDVSTVKVFQGTPDEQDYKF